MVLWTLYSCVMFAFRTVNTETCGTLYETCGFGSLQCRKHDKHFSCFFVFFLNRSKFCLNIVWNLYTMKSLSWSVRHTVVAGGFAPVFVEVKQNILSKKKAKRSHSSIWGVAIVNPGKEIEVRPHLVSEEIGKEELDQG